MCFSATRNVRGLTQLHVFEFLFSGDIDLVGPSCFAPINVRHGRLAHSLRRLCLLFMSCACLVAWSWLLAHFLSVFHDDVFLLAEQRLCPSCSRNMDDAVIVRPDHFLWCVVFPPWLHPNALGRCCCVVSCCLLRLSILRKIPENTMIGTCCLLRGMCAMRAISPYFFHRRSCLEVTLRIHIHNIEYFPLVVMFIRA